MRVASEIFQPEQFVLGRNRVTKQVEDLFLVFTYVSTQYNVIFTEFKNLSQNFFYFFYFYHCIYPPDSQESDGGAIHRVSNYPDLLPEMPRYIAVR